MAKISKSSIKAAGFVLIAVGAGLVFWGWQKSSGLNSRVSSIFTGSPTDSVVMFYIGGVVCLAAGIYLYIKK